MRDLSFWERYRVGLASDSVIWSGKKFSEAMVSLNFLSEVQEFAINYIFVAAHLSALSPSCGIIAGPAFGRRVSQFATGRESMNRVTRRHSEY